MITRKDFNEEYQKHVQMQSTKVLRICSKTQQRTRDELKIVGKWLKNVEFFKPFPDSLHRVIAEKLHHQHYHKGDYCIFLSRFYSTNYLSSMSHW